MNILSLIKFITSHPLNRDHKVSSVMRFMKWQLNARLNPYPIIYQYTDSAKLIVKKGMTGATGNLYCGLHEYMDMGFLLHLLRANDNFVDIGANVGSYTVLASAHVKANTFSFEPVPSTYVNLMNNISINNMSGKVTAHNLALGSKKGTIAFTRTFDTENHVASEGETDVISVPVETLDEIMKNMTIPPLLIKIDVEGFETEVLKGACSTLRQEQVKAIIIELNGSGERYGYDESAIHQQLLDLKFKPYLYDPKCRVLTPVDKFGTHNTIYIRDLEFVMDRLKTASRLRILDNEI